MITVDRLRKLLEDLPADAEVYGYEGEDVGIAIRDDRPGKRQFWWIRAREGSEHDDYTEGFTR